MTKFWIPCVMAALFAGAAAAGAEESGQEPAGVLTSESTHEMLMNLGYEPSLNSNKKSTIQIDRDGIVLHHLISTAPESLMLRVVVAAVPTDLELAAPGLQEFLKANEKIAPALFQYDASNRRMQLVKYVPNVGFTPAKLRREIEAFDEIARSYKPLWNGNPFRRIQPNSSPATVSELLRFEGTYALEEGSVIEGNKPTAEQRAQVKILISAAGEMRVEGQQDSARLVIDPDAAPGAVDVVSAKFLPQLGRYRLENGVLTLFVGELNGGDRPKADAVPKGKDSLLICRRIR